MRRIPALLLFAALFLSACNPTITLLTPPAESFPKTQTTLLPPAQARTPSPASQTTSASIPTSTSTGTLTFIATPTSTVTQVDPLGIGADALQGVEVLAWHGWDGVSTGLFAQMVSEFNLSNPWGIKVRLVAQRNFNLLAVEMEKSLATPERPDLIVALPEQILAWQTQVLDLRPYAAQPDLGFDLGEIPAAFAEQSSLDGVRYGLPAARSARFLFYNHSFARGLGFATAPQTPQEFSQQACAANAFWKRDADLTNDGYGGLALDEAANWQTPYSWLAAGGGDVFSAGEFHFNTPGNIAALELISQMRAEDCAWLPVTGANVEHLASRRALFITASLGEIAAQSAAFSAAASPDQWTLLPFPGLQPGIVAYGPDYAVLKSSEARQLASWMFIRWMLEAQNQVRWSRGTGLLPVTLPAIKLLKGDQSASPQWLAALDLIPQAQIYPQTAGWRLVSNILADGFIAYFRSFPNVPLADVFEMIDTTTQDLNPK